MKKYFFVLGNNPTLSIAELVSIFPNNKNEIINEKIFIIELDKNFNAQELIKKLGGMIKIGEFFMNERPIVLTEYKNILNQIIEFIDLKNINGKFRFGISYYGVSKFNSKPLAMKFKKYLKQAGISSRWVTSRDLSLSSVVVEQNKLTSNGIEIVLIQSGDKIIIGKTLAVQPFKELSFRDYGRPSRDDYSGMLPPKLAQIMINLALPHPSSSPLIDPLSFSPLLKGRLSEGGSEVILDPFCGSGTILTEAILMGYKNLIGADISSKATDNTKANISWIIKNYELRDVSYEIINTDVLQISEHIKPASVDAIITEPYLGPQRGKMKINEVIKELNDLYGQSLIEFAKILKTNGRVVMVWPVFRNLSLRGSISDRSSLKNMSTRPYLANFKIINPIPDHLLKNPVVKLTDRNTIIYGRPDQKVWREIVVMRKS